MKINTIIGGYIQKLNYKKTKIFQTNFKGLESEVYDFGGYYNYFNFEGYYYKHNERSFFKLYIKIEFTYKVI